MPGRVGSYSQTWFSATVSGLLPDAFGQLVVRPALISSIFAQVANVVTTGSTRARCRLLPPIRPPRQLRVSIVEVNMLTEWPPYGGIAQRGGGDLSMSTAIPPRGGAEAGWVAPAGSVAAPRRTTITACHTPLSLSSAFAGIGTRGSTGQSSCYQRRRVRRVSPTFYGNGGGRRWHQTTAQMWRRGRVAYRARNDKRGQRPHESQPDITA